MKESQMSSAATIKNATTTRRLSQYRNIVIVIPTYNEIQTIIKLIREIGELSIRDYQLSVLVVDDNSPDGTANAVHTYASNHKYVYLLSRPEKNGIGAAYIAGFNHAISALGADYVMQMDADYSHSPSHIRSLLEKLSEGYSVVIGSRYTQGGKITKDWPKIRLANSKVCNYWTQWVLGIKDIDDCTSGFKIIEVSLLKRVRFELYFAHNYSFQIVLLYSLLLQQPKITEVPITFQLRTHGHSKMVPKDTAELLWHVIRLRVSKRHRLVHSAITTS